MFNWLIPLLLLADASLVPAALKRWRYNTNFNNPDNWSLKRVPCPLDRAVFPTSFRRLGVLIPEGTTELRELVLPSDGELMLPHRGQIYFGEPSQGKKKNCTRSENVFTRTKLKSWLDPDNWIPEANDPSEATPHLERVPCRHDMVELPDDSSFGVRLPRLPVSVQSVKIGPHVLGPDGWQTVMESQGGWRFLEAPEVLRYQVVRLTMTSCTDPAGCVCLPDHYLLQEMVCSFERARCEDVGRPPCYDPIIPQGHCCAICGSFLHVKFDSSLFSLRALRNHIEQLLLEEEADNKVLFHASRIDDERVQVVLVDRGSYTGESVAFANKLYDNLRNNLELGVMSLSLVMAGNVLQPGALSRQVALVFGTLLATIVVLGGIFLVFVVFRDRLQVGMLDGKPFVFARFENVDTEAEAVEVVARPAAPQYDDDNLSKAFDNPMYGNTKGAVSKESSSVTHENPVYSELKRREEEPKEMLEITEMTDMKSAADEEEMGLVDIDIEDNDTMPQ